MTILGFKGNII